MMKLSVVQVLLLLAVLRSVTAACPYAGRQPSASDAEVPKGHPKVASQISRKLKQIQTTPLTYQDAMKALIADLEAVIGKCQLSLEGMKYANNDATVLVNSSSVFFPAASWLRAFFHDAGTFIASPSKGGPKGGPNGSLGVGCPSNTCGKQGSAIPVAPGTTCAHNDTAVSGFSDGLTYCCPGADECLAHGQSANNGLNPGQTVPVCLKGSQATVELCRRENDNLLPTIQFLRGRQANPNFQWGPIGAKQPLSFADILVAGAAVAVKQCSGSSLNITHTFGRPEATVADDTMLPSPTSIVEDKHFAVFQQMGLNKIDMVTMVTGSHAIGGFRNLSSPALTSCPYVPFDCTPAGQTATAPFDNNVFKTACFGVDKATCDWHLKCTNPSVDETAQGCPFTGPAREAYAQCNATSYPSPGLVSDIYLCSEANTRQRMVQYANDQSFFFKAYEKGFAKLAGLGYKSSDLMAQNW